MKKRILAMFLMSIMVFSLAGCGSGGNEETGGKDEKGKTTLRFVSWMTSGEDKKFLEKFTEENPDINLEVEAVDGTNYDKLLKTRLMSGDAPDVFLVQPGQYEKYVKEGYLLDVSDRPSMELLKKSQPLEDLYTTDGKVYGFPISTQGGPLPIFYNKKYFEKLNIEEPKTLDELFAICEKIKNDGVEPLVFGDKDAWTLEMFFRSRIFSGELKEHPDWGYDLYTGKIKPNEMFKNEYELMEKLTKEEYIGKSSLTMTYPQSVSYFVEGKAAMLPQGTWVPGLDEIKNADPEKFELGCFITPAEPTDGKVYMTGTSDRTIAISTDTKHKEAAQRLFDWFTKEDTLKEYLSSQSLSTFLPIDYDMDPVLETYNKELLSDNYELIMKQTATMPAGFYTMNENGFKSVLAGSSANDELNKLNSEFEKFKASVVVAE